MRLRKSLAAIVAAGAILLSGGAACAAVSNGSASPHVYAVHNGGADQFFVASNGRDMAVSETFFKKVFDSSGFSGRSIVLSDGCVIDDNWTPSTRHAPTECMDSRTGNNRGITNVEARSVLRFWRAMQGQKLAH